MTFRAGPSAVVSLLVGLGTVAAFAAPPLFEDATAEVGVDFVHRNGMTGKLYFAEMQGSGVGLFDADGDGDLDLYLVQSGSLDPVAPGKPRLSDRLYRNELVPSGTLRFVDVTKQAGLEGATGFGMGIAVGDVDNDGRVDFYLSNHGSNQLWRNVSSETGIAFEDVTATSGVDDRRWSVPALFFDYDADGRLDLFVGNYVDFRLATHKTCLSPAAAEDYCGPASYGAEPDRLFRGLRPTGGDDRIRFEDVSGSAGITETSAALGALADDFDGDGWVDLYVASDGGPNRLYLNQGHEDGDGGTHAGFFDDALLTGTAVNQDGKPEASMGVVADDVDGNGSPDLFMTHLDYETNTLYVNDGQGMFEDRSRESGLGNVSWRFTGFGTALADFDIDGHLDLLVVNGAVSIVNAQLTAGDPHPLKQSDLYFRGLGGGRFEEATAQASPLFGEARVSRGLATGDLDNDGDLDAVVTINHGPALVLRNTTNPEPRRWLGLRLVTADGRRDALGARAIIRRPGAVDLRRRVGADGSYGSARDSRILVGWATPVAAAGEIEVEVRWPDRQVERFSGIATGRYQTLRQGTGVVPTSSERER